MTPTANRYEEVLAKLPDTLEWSLNQDISRVSDYLLAADGIPRIFLGSGGSLSAAQLAMQLSVERGMVAAAMTPYQYIFSAWSKLPAKVFLFSASGRNIDAMNAYMTAHSNPAQQFGGMLMSSPSLLENNMLEDDEPNSFIYKLKNGDGFLATNSLLAFYSLLFRIYRQDCVSVADWNSFDSLGLRLKDFIDGTYDLKTETWSQHDAALYGAQETDRFYVLYAPETMPAAVDLESRFSEGSIGCLQISDYRNFAHGRFNWFHQRKGQTAIIALLTPGSEEIANNLLAELPSDIPIMKLSSEKNGSDGIIDLLIQGMYLSKYLGQRWGLDIGAPNVAEFGKIIHRMDFIEKIQKNENPCCANIPIVPDSILELTVEKISRVAGNIVRGETLWALKNRWCLDKVKEAGVELIIDCRITDFPDKFSELCQTKGIGYFHFPIDKTVQSDDEILKYLPKLFDLLDKKNCYISCQQGLIQTDIALSIYYMFHRPDMVPDLIGHKKNGTLKCDDIMRIINRIYSLLLEKGDEGDGIKVFNEAEFRRRRKLLLETNCRDIAANTIK